MGPGLTRIFFKSSENSPKPVLLFWSSIPCVFCLHVYIAKSCWLQRFECSVHASDGFQQKNLDGVGGLGELYPFFWDCNFFQLCKALKALPHVTISSTMVFNVAKIALAHASSTISLTKSLRVAGPLTSLGWLQR